MTHFRPLPAEAQSLHAVEGQAPAVCDDKGADRRRYLNSMRRMARVQAIIESNRAREERRLVAVSRVTHGSAEGEGRGVKALPSPAIPLPVTPPAGTVGAIVPRPPPRGAVAPALSGPLNFRIVAVEDPRWRAPRDIISARSLSLSKTAPAALPIVTNPSSPPHRASLLSRLASAVVGVFVGMSARLRLQRHHFGVGAFRNVEKTGVPRV